MHLHFQLQVVTVRRTIYTTGRERDMPYSIARVRFGKYNVIDEESDKVVGSYPTRRQALNQMRAMYANEPGSALTNRNLSPTDPPLWEKAKEEAKRRFSVYPSAYANAWAGRWYKERGGEWHRTKNPFVNSAPSEKKADTKEQDKEKPPVASPDTNVYNLTPYERFVPNDDKSNKEEKSVSSSGDTSASGDTTQKSGEKEKNYWLREPWVDISRPVIDEAGNVIGFHPCGRSTKEVRSAMDGYRTSYPRCVPRSKAMKMNAMQREELIRRTRKHEIDELLTMSSSDAENGSDDGGDDE